MKKAVVLLLVLFGFASNSFAETHGGVVISNLKFKAVSQYALGQGGDLYRVLNIKKTGADLFVISYGGMDNQGNEHVELKETVKTRAIADKDGAVFEESQIEVSPL